MSGPASDRAPSPFGPELRTTGRAIEVRRGQGARLALAVVIFVVGVAGALLITVQPLVGGALMLTITVPAVALMRASAWQRVASANGWIVDGAPVPWDVVSEIVLHRATVDGAVLIARVGPPLPLAVPVPTREALRERRIAEDTIARHLHQLAHAAGRPPIPVVIDLGPERPRVPFDPRCLRCSAAPA